MALQTRYSMTKKIRTEYQKPPGFAGWVFRKLLCEKESRFLTGDYEEIFSELTIEKGIVKAQIWYWTHLFFTLPHILRRSLFRSGAMIKNYIKITFRNIKRQKGYSFINISGLAIGMACCILILLFIQDELSYDRYHKNAENIYRITYNEIIGGVYAEFALSPFAFAPAMKAELPEVISYVRFFRRTGLFTIAEKKFEERNILLADSTFFEIFSHEFIEGVPETCLDQPRSIVLTEESAFRLFGSVEIIGRTMILNEADELTVTGVIRNVPRNSHFRFNYVVSSSTILSKSERFRQLFQAWLSVFGWSYLLLDSKADINEIESKFEDIFERNSGSVARQYGIEAHMALQKMTDIHLRSKLQDEKDINSDIAYIYIFSAIAVFILGIACINFINLSTARSVNRAREVGLRKVFGAVKKSLIRQFIAESTGLAIIALVIAIIIAALVLPIFNDISGKFFSLAALNRPSVWLGAVSLVVLTGLIAGSYPAFYLSGFDPVRVFRSKFSNIRNRFNFRNILVTLQFVISIVLITSTLIIIEQIEFMKNKNLGFDKEQVVVARVRGTGIRQNLASFKNELRQRPDIIQFSCSESVPGRSNSVLTIFQEGRSENESHSMDIMSADFDFVETMGIEILYGRDFSRDFTSDTSGVYLINETAAKKLGWGNEAVGKLIGVSQELMNKVVGIVKDFHFKSLKTKIEPLVIILDPQHFNYISIKMRTDNVSETISFIENKWKEFESDRSFNYFFLDEDFDSLYRSEEKLEKILTSFAAIAIFIACLGLFGLASFTAEQRTKEIGIRKTLGAAASNVFLILSADFTKWVMIANCAALPAGYYLMKNYWIQSFAYPVNIGIGLIFEAFVLSILIAALTVGFQTLKAASANPVESLRHE